jgi:hypothetical protein
MQVAQRQILDLDVVVYAVARAFAPQAGPLDTTEGHLGCRAHMHRRHPGGELLDEGVVG